MRRWIIVLALSCAPVVLATVPALAAGPALVSQGDPYASCSNAGQTGTNYPSAEVEPWVTAIPHTSNLVGVWQQDRWSNGGAHGLVAGRSADGGATWAQTDLPFSVCAPGAVIDPFTGAPYDRASDPWGTIRGNNDTAVAAAASTDGGAHWSNAQLIKSDQGTSPIFEFTQFFNDKESVTADPDHPGTAYVVWDRTVAPSHSPDAALRARLRAVPVHREP